MDAIVFNSYLLVPGIIKSNSNGSGRLSLSAKITNTRSNNSLVMHTHTHAYTRTHKYIYINQFWRGGISTRFDYYYRAVNLVFVIVLIFVNYFSPFTN